MSQPYLTQALETPLPKPARHVLIALSHAADDLGLVALSHGDLSYLTQMPTDRCRYHLRKLESAGLLKVLLRGYGKKPWCYQLFLLGQGGAA